MILPSTTDWLVRKLLEPILESYSSEKEHSLPSCGGILPPPPKPSFEPFPPKNAGGICRVFKGGLNPTHYHHKDPYEKTTRIWPSWKVRDDGI